MVSAVLNNGIGTVRFSEETASRVHKAANKLGYVPNKLTESIINKKALTVGVLCPWPDQEKYGKMIRYLSERLRNLGYHMIIDVCELDPKTVLEHFRDLASLQTGATIVLPFNLSLLDKDDVFEAARQCKAMSPATIAVDWYWEEYIFDTVNVNSRKLVTVPRQHLLERGHRNIVCLGAGSPLRPQYIREVLQQHGLEDRWEYCTSGLAKIYEQSYEEGQMLAKAALQLSPRPTALMCLHDRIAIGAYKACEQAGLRVGRDIAITGGDNMAITSQMTVPLTTMDIRLKDTTDALVDLLKAQMAGKISEKPNVREIDPQLIVRESSDFTVEA